jgi:hypothetical protein
MLPADLSVNRGVGSQERRLHGTVLATIDRARNGGLGAPPFRGFSDRNDMISFYSFRLLSPKH